MANDGFEYGAIGRRSAGRLRERLMDGVQEELNGRVGNRRLGGMESLGDIIARSTGLHLVNVSKHFLH